MDAPEREEERKQRLWRNTDPPATGPPCVPPVRAAAHRISVRPDGAAGAQRGLEAPERVLDRGRGAVVEAALERGRGGGLDAGAEALELLEAHVQIRARRPRRELAQRRVQRDPELQRRLAVATGGEV